jgi:SNF family Na+-dependent transporter
MTLPGDFFTAGSMLTLAGATVITTLITNSCQYAFNWNPKWLGLVVGIIITITGTIFTTDPKAVNFVMAVINGFLVYASSTGIMQMVGTPVPKPDSDRDIRSFKEHRGFLQQWY